MREREHRSARDLYTITAVLLPLHVLCTAELQQKHLSEPIQTDKTYDMVLCLSVGQYIPQEKEHILADNLRMLTGKYLILAWADSSLSGERCVNVHTASYLEELFCVHTALSYNEVATTLLRKQCWDARHQKTLMVFQKTSRLSVSPRPAIP